MVAPMTSRHILIVLAALLAVALAFRAAAKDDPPKPEPKPKKPKTVTIGKVTWYVSYDAALKVAKKAKKPLWLHFGENPG